VTIEVSEKRGYPTTLSCQQQWRIQDLILGGRGLYQRGGGVELIEGVDG